MKRKAKPTPAEVVPIAQVARGTVINLKGPQEQIDWLETQSRETNIPKAAIVRLGLILWSKSAGRPRFPSEETEANGK